MLKVNWTSKEPQEKGTFWFYGYPFGLSKLNEKDPPELCFVEVHKISNGFMYVTKGNWIYPDAFDKYNKAIGVWATAETPEFPTLAEM